MIAADDARLIGHMQAHLEHAEPHARPHAMESLIRAGVPARDVYDELEATDAERNETERLLALPRVGLS